MGRFADKYGRKASFMTGLLVFTLASACCALSPSLPVLIAFRCLQAVGAAILTPSSLGLVLTSIPKDRVTRGVRLWAVSASIAGAAGPVVGGLLTELSWRWIFLLNLPVGVFAIAVAWKLVPNALYDRTARIPDLFGSLMLILAISAISLGLVKGQDWGWGSTQVIACWPIAAAAAAAFIGSTKRAAVPVIEVVMFRSRVFAAANVGMALVAIALVLELLGMSLFLQQSWHWSTSATGAHRTRPDDGLHRLARRPAAEPALPDRRGRPGQLRAPRHRKRRADPRLHADDSYPAAILPTWLLIGSGLGLCLPTIVASATADLSP